MENSKRPILHHVMKRAADGLIPLQVSMELTHRCNLRCKHCYVDERSMDELSFKEIQELMNLLAEAGTMYLMFTGGEILVRSDFVDIARYAKKCGFLLILLTNGTLITRDIAAEFARLELLQVGMSIHGARPETHDSITGIKGSFQRLLDAIFLLKEFRVPVALQGTIMDTNVNEISEIKALAEKLGIMVRLSSEIVPARNGSFDPCVYQVTSRNVCKALGQQWIEESHSARDVGLCKAGRGICSIAPDGDVYPCLLMPLKIGNIRQTPFSELWKTKPCQELIKLRSITRSDLKECLNCAISSYCHRCLGVAYTETGSFTRPAPSACRNAIIKFNYLTHREEVVL